MWGNRMGWIISAGIAAVFGWILAVGAMPASQTQPTFQLSAVGQTEPTLPVDPLSIFKPGLSGRDAAELYRQAMHDYDEHADQYQNWEQDVPGAAAADPLGVRKIVEARDCGKMNLFAKDPKELVNYDNDTPTITAIHTLGTITEQIALYATQKGDMAKARKYAEAEFALGYNLANERVRFEEWNEGVQMMRAAALDLATAEPERAKEFTGFDDSTGKYMTDTIEPFWQKLDGLDPQGYAGDILLLADPQKNPEHLWRVEAILRVGRLYYYAHARGDQLRARHFLAQLVADPSLDPLTHTAAAAAQELTQNVAEYNRIH